MMFLFVVWLMAPWLALAPINTFSSLEAEVVSVPEMQSVADSQSVPETQPVADAQSVPETQPVPETQFVADAQYDTEAQIDAAIAEVKTYYLQDTDRALEQLEVIRRSSEQIGYPLGIVEYFTISTELSQTVGGEDQLLADMEALDIDGDERFRDNPDLYHRLDLNKAILLSNQRKQEESMELLSMLERESNDPFILAAVYGTMGSIFRSQGEYDKSLEYTLKSIDYFKAEGNIKNYVFGLTNVADILMENERYMEALTYLDEAVTYLDELQNARMSFSVYSSLGVLYKDIEQYNESITYHGKALDVAVTLRDPMFEAITSLNIANSYKNVGDYERALQFYQRSMQLSRRMDVDYGIYINFINLGTLYQESGDLRMATVALDSALVYATKLDYPSEKSTLYESMSNLYMQLGDPVLELEYYKKHIELKDQLFNEEKNRAIEDLRIKYETDLKEQELELVASELENKTIQFQLTLSLLGLLLFVLFGTGLYFIRQNQSLQALYDRNLEILNNYVPVKELQSHKEDDAKGSLKSVFENITKAMEQQKLFTQADLTLADLVQKLDVNEKYISQAISLYGNKSFYQFLHYYRINEARRLLVESDEDLQIKEIMYNCGYRSRSTFINAFKEYTGMTPSQFKSRLSQQKSA